MLHQIAKFFFFLILFTTVTNCVTAQNGEGKMYLNIKEAFRHKPKFMFNMDAHNSFLRDREAGIFGIKCGLEFNHRVRVGLGYYFMTSNLQQRIIENGDTSIVPINFYYFSTFFEYVFFRNKRWEFSMPLALGFGESKLQGIEPKVGDFAFMIEGSVQGYYKVFSWIGLGAGWGLRVMPLQSQLLGNTFTSPFYVLKLRIFLKVIYRGLFKHDRPWKDGRID